MKCNKCGSEVTATTGGNYHCPKCGFSVNDLVYRGNGTLYTPPSTPPSYGFGNTGWICPKCGRGVSPYTNVCPCYHQGYGNSEITCDTLDSAVKKISTTLNGNDDNKIF